MKTDVSPEWRTRLLLTLALTFAAPVSVACQNDAPAYLQPADEAYMAFFEETAVPLLPGYRLPRETDFESYWTYFDSYIYRTRDDADNTKAPFWTKGLFNDDDVVDWAFIVVDEADETMALFAIVSTETGGYATVMLDDGIEVEMG